MLITSIRRLFGRNSLRRELKLDPQLKNLAGSADIQGQIQNLREEYKLETLTSQNITLISQALTSPIPLPLSKRFHVDEVKLSKQIKKQMNESINEKTMERLQGFDENSKLIGKSHLYDQKQEIEMQKEFNKQLFRRKQTRRLIQKKKQLAQTYLPETEDTEFKQYQENKKKLENLRLEAMLNGTKENKQLQLLIQSGLMEKTENLKKLVGGLKQETKLLGPSTELVGNNSQNMIQNMDLKVQNELVQLKNFDKLKEFVDNYQQQSQQQRQRTETMLELLDEIKKYQEMTFSSRYEALNYRYKGRVDFNYMTEPQLMSYLKHQKIQPKDLLLIFQQNFQRISKINKPIITPTVAGQLFTLTSTHKYPETPENNHINMLRDPLYVKLQRYAFNNISLVSDTTMADMIGAYCHNHKEEQGSLRPKLFQRILEKICTEFQERVGYLDEKDLGLICRSLTKVPVFGKNLLQSDQFVETLSERIKDMSDMYAIEGVCLMLSLMTLKESQLAIYENAAEAICSQPANWDHHTVANICRVFPRMLNHNITELLKKTIKNNEEQVCRLLKNNILNDLPLVGSFLHAIKLPSLPIFNLIKKQTVQTIRKQLSRVYPSTIPKLISCLTLFDYQRRYSTYEITNHLLIQSMFIISPLKFNSSKYLPYHEMAKFLMDQPIQQALVCQALRYLSMVAYKNQGFYDKMIESLIRGGKLSLGNVLDLLYCYHLQKRQNQISSILKEKINEKGTARVEQWIEYLVGNFDQPTAFQQFQKNVWPYKKYLGKEQLAACIMVAAFNNKTDIVKEIFELLASLKNLKLEIQLIVRLSLQLMKQSINVDLPSLNDLQKRCYDRILPELMERHDAIGSRYGYEKIRKEFSQQIGGKLKPWRVEAVDKVYLLLTYDMLTAIEVGEQEKDKTWEVKPRGIWRLYQRMYENKGIQVKIFETYLWKNL